MVRLIAAYSEKGRVIGTGGSLPWYIPEDLKRFKKLTMGKFLIMGRKTFDSIGSKPLAGRINIVISRRLKDNRTDGILIARSLNEALEMANFDCFIIGGGEIYKEAIEADIVDEFYLTEVWGEYKGDVQFPQLDKNKWGIMESQLSSGCTYYKWGRR
jgi:dihydrofolate reductase